jgi:hypothetical protein
MGRVCRRVHLALEANMKKALLIMALASLWVGVSQSQAQAIPQVKASYFGSYKNDGFNVFSTGTGVVSPGGELRLKVCLKFRDTRPVITAAWTQYTCYTSTYFQGGAVVTGPTAICRDDRYWRLTVTGFYREVGGGKITRGPRKVSRIFSGACF